MIAFIIIIIIAVTERFVVWTSYIRSKNGSCGLTPTQGMDMRLIFSACSLFLVVLGREMDQITPFKNTYQISQKLIS